MHYKQCIHLIFEVDTISSLILKDLNEQKVYIVIIYFVNFLERTDKVPMNTIKSIVSESIEGHEEYHIMVSYVAFVN